MTQTGEVRLSIASPEVGLGSPVVKTSAPPPRKFFECGRPMSCSDCLYAKRQGTIHRVPIVEPSDYLDMGTTSRNLKKVVLSGCELQTGGFPFGITEEFIQYTFKIVDGSSSGCAVIEANVYIQMMGHDEEDVPKFDKEKFAKWWNAKWWNVKMKYYPKVDKFAFKYRERPKN